ncbi:hypothetical protein PTKIN_Ptkin18bG0055900 [Pterospermum kingtungense]
MTLLTTATLTKPLLIPSSSSSSSLSSNSTSTSTSSVKFQLQTHSFTRLCVLPKWDFRRNPLTNYSVRKRHVVCMAPEEERMTRRSPLDFPIEWERPKPGRRPDIFPQFSPMKTPLPIPMPADPPEEEEEEEEEKEEEEEDPEKEEEQEKPAKQ